MCSSDSQYCSRSLPETSARLPAETNVETPIPRRAASPSTATPSAPDWAKNPARPASGGNGASEAFSETVTSVLMMPRQFGPTTRMPLARAAATTLRCGPAGGALVGVAALAEPAAEDHQAAHAARGAVVHDLDDGGRGHRDHDEVERRRGRRAPTAARAPRRRGAPRG